MHLEIKMINVQQRFINLMVYKPLLRTLGEQTPSAGLEPWKKPTSPSHEELGLGSPLAAS